MPRGRKRGLGRGMMKAPLTRSQAETEENRQIDPGTAKSGGRGEEPGREIVERNGGGGVIEGETTRPGGKADEPVTVVGEEENADGDMAGYGVGLEIDDPPGDGGNVTGQGIQNAENEENEPNNTSQETVEIDRWTPAKEDKLIDLFRDATHLWDKKAAGYKTRNKYEMAYKAWSAELLIPDENIKQRLKTMRDTFTRSIKPPKSGSEPKQLTIRQQYIISRFSFMKGHTHTRGKTISTLTDELMQDYAKEQDEMNKRRRVSQENAGNTSSPQNPSPTGGGNSGGVNEGGRPSPLRNTTPTSSPSTRGGRGGRGRSPRSAVSRVLNVDVMPCSTTPSSQQRFSTPPCPTSSERGCRGRGRPPLQTSFRKRNCDGSQKRTTTKPMSDESQDGPDYTHMLKDLTDAVTKTSPRKDKLDKWGEVLVGDIREFPVDVQHEARHHIDNYVMNVSRSLRSYSLPPNKNTNISASATSSSASSAAPSNPYSECNVSTHQSAPLVPPSTAAPPHPAAPPGSSEIDQQKLTELQNALYPPCSPARQNYPPSNIGSSPGAAELLRRILGPPGPSATYQGHY